MDKYLFEQYILELEDDTRRPLQIHNDQRTE